MKKFAVAVISTADRTPAMVCSTVSGAPKLARAGCVLVLLRREMRRAGLFNEGIDRWRILT
jgi:hypothetical protein